MFFEYVTSREGEKYDAEVRMNERGGVPEAFCRDGRDFPKLLNVGDQGSLSFFRHTLTLASQPCEWDRGAMTVRTKRIYEESSLEDGYRVLVDRIWPRGVSKRKANLDEWLKGVAPSTELRKWFDHEDPRWPEFQKRYRAELENNPEVEALRQRVKEHDVVTLLYSARNVDENQAVALRDFLT